MSSSSGPHEKPTGTLSSKIAVNEIPVGKPPSPAPQQRKGLHFWLIFVAVCISVSLTALELTAVATALPTIVADLQGDNFIWVGSAYVLASTALLPASGALSEIFGRRSTMLVALGIFALGSVLCATAQSMSWLIAARTIQGTGCGAIQTVANIIISDLVSLRERGIYNSALGLTWGLACSFGPLVGGALAKQGQWRWIFYLNLPICAFSAASVFAFLKLRTPEGTLKDKLARMDWIGNVLIISSASSTVIGLTWGGAQFPWNSTQVLIPLILGLCGIGLFVYYEARFAKHPMAPFTIISNRSSISGYIQIFMVQVVMLAVTYYLGTYYQASRGASPIRAGVLGLAMTTGFAPSMIGCGLSITITKTYRIQLWIGWAVLVIAMGVMSTVDSRTELSKPVGYTSIIMIGGGMLYAGTYFPVLAPLPVSENAHALAFFVFCRTFAGVWGVTIGGTILQNQLQKRLPAEFLSGLPEGVTLVYSAIPSINGLSEPLRSEVRQAFAESIAVIWQVMAGIAGMGLIASLFMKAFPLHTQTDERWGLEDQQGAAESEEIVLQNRK